MLDYLCKKDFKNCPFKMYDLEKEIIICNYFEVFWSTARIYGHERAKELVNKACEDIRSFVLHQRQIAEFHTKKTLDMLRNAKKGDKLFWFSRDEDVIFIEMTSEINNLVRCKCQRKNNEIVYIPAYLLLRISTGNFSREYDCNTNIYRAKRLQYQAKSYGFKAKIDKKGINYILRIFGDSQDEVDDFISLYILQKQYIRP